VLYGSGDPDGLLAVLREMVENHMPPFLPGTLHDLAAPDGLPVAWVRGLASLPSSLLFYGLALLVGPAAAINLFALFAGPLTGLATFLLARKLTGNPWAAAIAGWAFAFYPFAVIKGAGHYELAHGWVIVLPVWRLLVLSESPSMRTGIWAGLAVVFAMAWTPYFILIVGLSYAALLAGSLALAAHRRCLGRQLAPQAVAGALVLTYLVGFYALGTTTESGQGLRENNVQDLNIFSARVYEYFVPNADHPLVGSTTGPWLASHLHGSNPAESTLYLGLTIICLAVVAVVTALRRRLSAATARAVFLLAIMGLCTAWSSAPPHGMILGANIPFPSDPISKVTTTWRVYARLVEPVMLAASLLAAIGITAIADSASRWRRTGILILIAVAVIALDLRPKRHDVSSLGTRPIYAQLARLPKGIVAVYPTTSADVASYVAMRDQQYYDMPIINGSARDMELADPANPTTARSLAALGVRYALVPAIPETARLRFPPRDFRRVAHDASGSVYAVAPRLKEPATAVFFVSGFGPAEAGPDGPFRWLEQSSGKLEVDGACMRCAGTLRALIQSFAHPRTVEFRDPRGHVLLRQRVAGPTQVVLPLRFAHRTDITLVVTPRATPVRQVMPSTPDDRSLAINVARLRFDASTPARAD
jgi:hypothetical protein